MNKVIEDGLKHFRAKAARYRKLAEQAESEISRLEALAQHKSQPTQRAADGRDASQIDAAFVAGWEAYREAFDHYDDNDETVAHSLEWRKQEYLADAARR